MKITDKVELMGFIVLAVGVILLAFTFFSAYEFLVGRLYIPGSQNIVTAFGQVLAPLIEAIIRILYLGIMGWVGSVLTIRAVQLLKKERTETPSTQPKCAKTESKQTTQQTSKPEVTEIKTEPEKQTDAKKEETAETPESSKEVKKPEEIAEPSAPTPTPAS